MKIQPYTTPDGQVLNHFTDYVFPVAVPFEVEFCHIIIKGTRKNGEVCKVYGDTDKCLIFAESAKDAGEKLREAYSMRDFISAYPCEEYPAHAYRPEPDSFF